MRILQRYVSVSYNVLPVLVNARTILNENGWCREPTVGGQACTIAAAIWQACESYCQAQNQILAQADIVMSRTLDPKDVEQDLFAALRVTLQGDLGCSFPLFVGAEGVLAKFNSAEVTNEEGAVKLFNMTIERLTPKTKEGEDRAQRAAAALAKAKQQVTSQEGRSTVGQTQLVAPTT